MKNIFFVLSKINWEMLILSSLLLILFQNAVALPSNNKSIQETPYKQNTYHNDNSCRSNPYVGVEAGFVSQMLTPIYSYNAFRRGYGSTSYQKNPMLYGIFFGKDLHEYVSVEFGYETQHKKERIEELGPGGIVPGLVAFPLLPGDGLIIKTGSRTEYWNAGLKFKLKDYHLENKNIISLWTKLGVSYAQVRATQEIIADERTVLTAQQREDLTRTFKCKKLVPSAQVGLDYTLAKNWSLRTYLGLKNLRLLKAKPKENPAGNSEIKLRDSIQLSLGLTYRL